MFGASNCKISRIKGYPNPQGSKGVIDMDISVTHQSRDVLFFGYYYW